MMPRCINENVPGKECPRPDVRLVNETGTDWTFRCMTCDGIRVMTKPAGWRRAKMENEFRSGAKQRSSYDRKRLWSTDVRR